MSKYLTAVLAAFVAAQPALAADPFSTGDSHGPRMPHSYTADSYTGTYLSNVLTGNYAYSDAPASVAEQIAANNEHELRTYTSIRENGGCNADFITTEIATHCNKNVFGGPQMGSND